MLPSSPWNVINRSHLIESWMSALPNYQASKTVFCKVTASWPWKICPLSSFWRERLCIFWPSNIRCQMFKRCISGTLLKKSRWKIKKLECFCVLFYKEGLWSPRVYHLDCIIQTGFLCLQVELLFWKCKIQRVER